MAFSSFVMVWLHFNLYYIYLSAVCYEDRLNDYLMEHEEHLGSVESERSIKGKLFRVKSEVEITPMFTWSQIEAENLSFHFCLQISSPDCTFSAHANTQLSTSQYAFTLLEEVW